MARVGGGGPEDSLTVAQPCRVWLGLGGGGVPEDSLAVAQPCSVWLGLGEFPRLGPTP